MLIVMLLDVHKRKLYSCIFRGGLNSGGLWIICLILLISSAPSGIAGGYFGPLVTLENSMVILQVSPKVGRIVSYHRKGERNWLATNDSPPSPASLWNPWGGDRIWPLVQSLNEQVYKNEGPDPVVDGQPWELISQSSTRVEMRSQVSPQLGLRVTRRIDLIENSTTARLTFRLERTEESAFPVHVWTVTGIRPADFVLIESDTSVPHSNRQPFKWWRDVSVEKPDILSVSSTDVLKILLTQKKLKIGAFGRWIAAVNGTSAFLQVTSLEEGEQYLDSSNLQVYMDPKYSIYEIETLSPDWMLRKGDSREWTVEWSLVEFPHEARTDKAKVEFLEHLAKDSCIGAK